MIVGVKGKYFRTYDSQKDQMLYEKLINEAIRIHGIDIYYIARNYTNFDQVYGADDQSVYQYAWMLAVYLRNVLGFTGDREFLSKFAGMEIRDQIIVSVPVYGFDQVVASDANFPPLPNLAPGPANRPREGDLLWMPMNQKCFQIKYTNLTDMFFPFGKIHTWECTCELFEYSSETFNTGIPEIDRIQIRGDLNVLDYAISVANGVPILTFGGDYWVADTYNLQDIAQSDNLAEDHEANTYIDFTEIDPFGDT